MSSEAAGTDQMESAPHTFVGLIAIAAFVVGAGLLLEDRSDLTTVAIIGGLAAVGWMLRGRWPR